MSSIHGFETFDKIVCRIRWNCSGDRIARSLICYNFEVEGIFYDFVACVLCIYLVVGGKKFIDDLIKINREAKEK